MSILRCFILFLLAQQLAGQSVPVISRLTVNDGLSQEMIFDMIQSKDGFIWIATKDGLNRYDGSRFKIFSPDPFNPFAVGGGEIRQLFEDSRGWIWVEHENGLDILDVGSDQFFHVNIEEHYSFLCKLVELEDGTIWFCGQNEVIKLLPNKDLLIAATKNKQAHIKIEFNSISLDKMKDGSHGTLLLHKIHYSKTISLLVGTTHGLFKIDPSTQIVSAEYPMPGIRFHLYGIVRPR
ncbi:MAG: hypothetical protein IPM48_05795 [Saprospiraceae bacterium]|nr:hypothetical protein [Saprospiraceae bacterium]